MSNSSIYDWAKRNKLLLDKSKCTSAGETTKQCIILVNHWCHRLILFIAQLSLIIMLMTVFMNVVLRFCFNSGIKWAEEVPGLLVTLFTFLACAIGCRQKGDGYPFRYRSASLWRCTFLLRSYIYNQAAPGLDADDRLADMAQVHPGSDRRFLNDVRPALIPLRHSR